MAEYYSKKWKRQTLNPDIKPDPDPPGSTPLPTEEVDTNNAVIGLEIHVQLKTDSKLFCPCSTSSNAAPNQNICPICCGMPGTLPVLNKRAVDLAILASLALTGRINPISVFERKHYFYPDLPKGFQITQHDNPLSTGGHLNVQGNKISIRRCHLEEDAGKLIHGPGQTEIDLNRAGIPMVEIVTEPSITQVDQALIFLKTVRLSLIELGVTSGKMEEGNFRFDANVSLARAGTAGPDYKVEVKNLNSFRHLAAALKYEIDEQTRLLKSAELPVSSSKYWNAREKRTELMRLKEETAEYRFFPEPDLGSLIINHDKIERIRKQLSKPRRHLPDRLTRRRAKTAVSGTAAAPLMNADQTGEIVRAIVAEHSIPLKASSRDRQRLLRFLMGKIMERSKNRAEPRIALVFLSRVLNNQVETGKPEIDD